MQGKRFPRHLFSFLVFIYQMRLTPIYWLPVPGSDVYTAEFDAVEEQTGSLQALRNF